jgi:hypothetical protein
MKKKGLITIIIIIAAVILTSAILIPLKAEDSRKGQDIAEIVDVVHVMKLTNELSLSTEQLMSFYPKYKQMQDFRKQYWLEKREALKNLRDLDEKSDVSEAELQTALNKLYEIEDKFVQDMAKLRNELNSELTLKQKVRFAISNDNLRRDVRQLLIKLKDLGEFKKRQPLLIKAEPSD